MTQGDRQLLLKDICARLPYELKVKCEKYPFPVTVLYAGNIDEVKFVETGGIEHICLIKPYLRPMSSMTEEELKMFKQLQVEADEAGTFEGDMLLYDWLNKNHFDYRLLIFQGLALEAPEGMYKF